MVHFEEDNPDDLLGNMVVLGVSLIVIAAVVIGVVAGIDHDDAPLKPEKMTLDAICDLTDYKESCMASLQPVGNYAQVITYFRAAVNATISEMALAMKKAKVDADAVRDDRGSTETTMAFEDCIELIGLCIEELQSVLTMVNATPNLFFKDSGDARSSLSAVLSYQRACLEGLKESRSTSDMDRGLQKPSELASNALAIIYEHSENNDLEADHSIPNWGTGTTDNDGMIYPDRLSAADRKLLHNSYKKGGQMMTPHAVVAKDGSGQYASIAAALNAYPIAHKGRYLIYVRSGVYEENVIISKNITQIFMYGDGVNRTVISGRDFNGTTYRRASLSVIGNGFICKDIGIKIPDKSRGNSMAAVKIQSDSAAFFHCRITGSTTSCISALAHRQFFIDCEIYGVTNIIRGDAAVVIQRSKIIVTQETVPVSANIIALQGRSDKRESTGFVIHGCTIEPDKSSTVSGVLLENSAYLGMAVEKYSRTIVMESSLEDIIHPDGWYNNNNYGIETVTFAEYRNKGPGAGTSKRVKWPGYSVINNRSDALRYTAGRFIEAQNWLQGTQVPLQAGLFS